MELFIPSKWDLRLRINFNIIICVNGISDRRLIEEIVLKYQMNRFECEKELSYLANPPPYVAGGV
jgi:hypothetical protein